MQCSRLILPQVALNSFVFVVMKSTFHFLYLFFARCVEMVMRLVVVEAMQRFLRIAAELLLRIGWVSARIR